MTSPTYAPVYLDHNATTPLLPEVFDAMLPYLREHFGNPSSDHVYGRRARAAVDDARAQVAALLGCNAEEVVFTSGGTEANNLAIYGVLATRGDRDEVVTSAIEHPATREVLRAHAEVTTRALGVDGGGVVRLDEAITAITARTALVTVIHANNETGVLQPVGELAARARTHGALAHTDAAQSIGKVPVDVGELGVDLLSVAGHKLYAPKGVGALYVRRGVVLRPFARGAGHEGGLRPGTENVASIVGLGVACALARRDLDEVATRTRRLRDRLWSRLRDEVPGITRNGHATQVLPNTLSARFPGVSGAAVLREAPDVAASTGSACHAGVERASSVITAMGVSPEGALGTVRLTVGRGTTDDDIDRAVTALATAWRRLRGA